MGKTKYHAGVLDAGGGRRRWCIGRLVGTVSIGLLLNDVETLAGWVDDSVDDAAHFHDRKDRLQNQLGVEEKEVTDPALLRGEGPEEAKDVAPAGNTSEDGRGDGVSRRRGRPARADQVVCETCKSYKRDDCPR